ncbi:MAG: hypothetical protein LQ340_005314 [Diploschistes diacapsis]|nr:MAG: hypothetical protein LQ340_005314 [Diploschistes diacapsis]
MMLETAMLICSEKDTSEMRFRFQQLVRSDLVLTSMCKSLCHNWLSSLPRIFQSKKKKSYERQIARIGVGYGILVKSHVHVGTLGETFTESLKNSLEVVFKDSGPQSLASFHSLHLTTGGATTGMEFMGFMGAIDDHHYLEQDALLSTSDLHSLEHLLLMIQPLLSQPELNMLFLDSISSLPRRNEATSLWILAKLLRIRKTGSHAGQRLPTHNGADFFQITCNDIALDGALSTLSGRILDTKTDWRAKVLSLEILALLAQNQREEFRATLVDSLYPMVRSLGSRNSVIRKSAMRGLVSVSEACGYIDVGDMIIENVDYLVNAVALRLNTFDLDPCAPQVLVVMIELSGSALIPCLDDILDSIFATLASYHGYHHLVESLFSVLSSIVNQASVASGAQRMSALTHQRAGSIELKLDETISKLDAMDHCIGSAIPSDLDFNEDGDIHTATMKDELVHQSQEPAASSDTPVDVSKTYSTVQSIVRLCQHYLTHEDAQLRQQLLNLVATGCSILSRNEDEFLPLVNDIWPVTIQRLFDEEPKVAVAAMHAISKMSEGAGDFLASRVEDQWIAIRTLYWQLATKASAVASVDTAGNLSSVTRQMHDSIVNMLADLANHVRITPDMEDDIFAMLGGITTAHDRFEASLRRLNDDALWLTLDAQSFHKPPPILEGFSYHGVEMD